jgi:hypothetical protein
LVDDGSYSVNNFGLMQDRQTGLIVSALIFVSGIFLILSGSKEEERMQSQISNNSPQNVVAAKFKGNKDLNNDSYKLYLVDEFNINKNPVLDKFSCNDKAFDSLELALKYGTKNNYVMNAPIRLGKEKGPERCIMKMDN